MRNLSRRKLVVGAMLMALLAGGLAWLLRAPFGRSTHAGTPVIQFMEQSFHAGKVRGVDAAKIRHAFRFKNMGGADLVLGEIKTSCGCTVATLPKKHLAPVEESAVDVVLSLTSVGEVARNILIYSNAPKSPHQLTLGADFHPTKYCQVTPEVLSMGLIEDGQSGQQDFEVN